MKKTIIKYTFLALIIFIPQEFIFAQTSIKSSDFAEDFLPRWQRAKDYTLEVAEAMPEHDYDFKPMEDVDSFTGQLGHLIGNFSFLQSFISETKENPLKGINLEGKSKKEVKEEIVKAFDFIADLAKNTPDHEITKKIQFFRSEVLMTKGGIFYLIRDHVTHHRAEMIVYLRLKGIKPPKYVGW